MNAVSAAAQEPRDRGSSALFPRVGEVRDDEERTRQLLGFRSLAGFLLRSPSSEVLVADSAAPLGIRAYPVDVLVAHNSAMPLSLNDGALWAGRGTSARLSAAVHAGFGDGRVRVLLAPELLYAANQEYALTDPTLTPAIPATRHPLSSPWHAGGLSVDVPLRFGTTPIRRLVPGQSALVVRAARAEVGIATENEWWGPGRRNALLLSSNAGGFPHFFLRTGAPIATRAGSFGARWIVGGLSESSFFDFDPENDLRSLSAAAVTWQPVWTPGLEVGAARAVFAPASGWGDVARDSYQLFTDVGHPSERPAADSTRPPGRDQLLSFFARLVLPSDRAEFYVEWGRASFPNSLRDFLVDAGHSRGYTIGGQWLSAPFGSPGGRIRIGAEVSTIERSTSYRYRYVGSWYASGSVDQGYTNEGQSLGAAIGPGASSQYANVDYVASAWSAGAFLGRIRWLNDVHSTTSYPTAVGWCEHDVSIMSGLEGRLMTRSGLIRGWISSGKRMNPFFKYYGAFCPDPPHADVRNTSLTLSFTPRAIAFRRP